jgi:uridine kinase
VKSLVIGIAGLSGSGKTALARQLAPRLDAPSEILALDSYYHTQSHLSLEDRARVNYDHPCAIDWDLLFTHLEALSRGQAVAEPRYLFDQHTRAGETRVVQPTPYLILEGILALHRPEVRSLLDLKVFVTTQPEECLRRRLQRDMAERGRTHQSVLQQYNATVWPMALEYVLPSGEFADVTVSGEEPIDRSVEAVLATVRRATAA